MLSRIWMGSIRKFLNHVLVRKFSRVSSVHSYPLKYPPVMTFGAHGFLSQRWVTLPPYPDCTLMIFQSFFDGFLPSSKWSILHNTTTGLCDKSCSFILLNSQSTINPLSNFSLTGVEVGSSMLTLLARRWWLVWMPYWLRDSQNGIVVVCSVIADFDWAPVVGNH